MATNLINAVGYIRVSTKAQAGEDRCGKEAQKQAIEQYAAENGYTIVKWYEDEISGVKDNRPAFDQILYGDNVTNPPYEAVIAYKSDRIARDTKLYFYFLYVLEKKNIKLISTKEDFGDDNGLSYVYRSLMLFVAEQERKNIQMRTAGGRKVKALNGGFAGGNAPYGYKISNKQLVVVPEEAEVVRMLFSVLDRGGTLQEAAETVNEAGYRARNGRWFDYNRVRSIRENRKLYEGFYKYGDMEDWVPGRQEAIIEKADVDYTELRKVRKHHNAD